MFTLDLAVVIPYVGVTDCGPLVGAMNRGRILIVDTDLQCRRLLEPQLLALENNVRVVDRGEDGILAAAEFEPDLILMALSLPGISGLDTCRRMRECTRAPIIVLDEEGHDRMVDALDQGADDYVTKPFRMDELLARMRAVLRRGRERGDTRPPATVLTLGGLTIDLINRAASVAGRPLHLTPTEYDLLRLLASHPGSVLTHREILTHVWGATSADDTQYLHVFVGQLRRKLDTRHADSTYIFTEHGVGYRFSAGPFATANSRSQAAEVNAR